MDRFGYARTIDTAAYERNKEAAITENRFVFPCKNTGKVCLFTDTGQLYTVKVSDLPFGKFRDKAIPLDNVSNFDSTREQLLLAVGQSELNLYRLLIVTKQGMTKMVDGGEFDVRPSVPRPGDKAAGGRRGSECLCLSGSEIHYFAVKGRIFPAFRGGRNPGRKRKTRLACVG